MKTQRSVTFALVAALAGVVLFTAGGATQAGQEQRAESEASKTTSGPAVPDESGEAASKPTVFRGRVLGPDLKPIEDAVVTLVRPPEARTEGSAERLRRMIRMFRESPANAGPRPEFHVGRSDARGRVEIALPDAGPWNLRIEAPGLAPTIVERVRTGAADLPLYLKPGETLSGTVVDRGSNAPVTGATVLALSRIHRGFRDPGSPDRFAVTARSGEDGRFRLAGLATNFYDVSVTAPGRARTVLSNVSVGESGSDPLLALMEPGFTVSGRVVDSDGAGVEGAVVRVAISSLDLTGRRGRQRGLIPERPRPHVATTDAAGRFEIPGLDVVSSVTLDATGPAEGTGRVRVTVPGGRAAVTGIEIPLRQTARLAGRLIDADETPVEATLSLAARFEEDGAPERPRTFRASGEAAGSDASGVFEVDGVPPGTANLSLRVEGYRPLDIEAVKLEPGKTRDLGNLVLDPGLSISGRVTDGNDRGLEGVRIQTSSFGRGEFQQAETTSGEDGRYRAGGLDSATFTLTAKAEGFAEERREGVEAGSEDVDFVLAPAGLVTGRVVAGDPPAPVTTFRAKAHNRESGGRGGFMRALLSEAKPVNDARGRFRLTDLAAGEYTIELTAQGHPAALREGVVVKPGETTDLGEITMEPGVRVSGTVLDPDGSPVVGAEVFVRPSGFGFMRGGGGDGPKSLTGLSGRFTLDGLAAGAHTLVAAHPDFARTEAKVAASTDAEPEPVVITLGRGGTISGTVRDGNGLPMPGATVSGMRMPGTGGLVSDDTDDRGGYTLENLAEGAYTVMIRSRPTGGTGPGNFDSKQADVRTGETTVVNFGGDEPRITVSGIVSGRAGPLPEASVVWSPASDGGRPRFQFRRARTDENGRYEVDLPSSGDWSVRVSASGSSWRDSVAFTVEVPQVEAYAKNFEILEGGVSGTVLDAMANEPIENVRISAYRVEEEEAQDDAPAPAGRGGSGSRAAASGTSSADGTYALDGLSPGRYRIVASSREFARSEIEFEVGEGGSTGADFYLEKGRQVRARVVDTNGRPVPEAIVVLLDADGPTNIGEGPSGMTGVDGTVVLEGVAEANYAVLAVSRGLAPEIQPNLEVTAERAAAAEIVVGTGGALEVLVVRGEEAEPVSGASVSLTEPGGRDVSFLVPALRMLEGLSPASSDDGILSFPHLTSGKWHVRARAESGGSAEGSVEVFDGRTARLTLTLE